MDANTPIEIADHYSRKRALVVAMAALGFVGIHVAVRTVLAGGPPTAHYATPEVMWALNALVLFAVLATGGGLGNRTEIRMLVNDEVAQANHRSAVAGGFWVAMATAMTLYLAPGLGELTGRQAVFVIVTTGLGVALLAFAWLEYRAHLDA